MRSLLVLTCMIIGFSTALYAQDDTSGPISEVRRVDNPSATTQPAAGPALATTSPGATNNYDMSLAGQQSDEAEKLSTASAPKIRRFHEVLDEVLAEFGYDVRMKQLDGLKNISIRRVAVSDTLPQSYSDYVELLVAERIRENSRVRLISCIPCKTRTSRLVDAKLRITSPITNVTDMNQAAESLGIENFMDVVFVYHTTHMVLAFQIFDTNTKEMVWARTYNSETVKSRYQKLAVDYSQVAKSRPGEEYVPDYRYMFGAGGAFVPNLNGDAGDSTMMAVEFRGTEKFNNRHSEFGLMLDFYNSFSTFISEYPSSGVDATTPEPKPGPTPFKTAFGLTALFAHNFLGSIESYNTVRYGVHTGVGVLFAPGYLPGTLRLGLDSYFGRAFAVSMTSMYVMPSTILVRGANIATKGGPGGALLVSYNF